MAALALSVAAGLPGQVPLNPSPSRAVGHARLQLSTANPNLVEGREFYSPQGIALDASARPPILYVSDSGNNRILVWTNARGSPTAPRPTSFSARGTPSAPSPRAPAGPFPPG
jgi:sugar lactone lactonase YvrE